MTPKLLTPSEVAEALRTPEDTLRHWRDKNTGPLAVKIGRRILYREEDVASWLADQAAAAERRAQVAR